MFPSFIEMPFTYTICLLVMGMSITGFYHKPFYQFFIYHPYQVFRGKRIHTIFTSALVHKNWWHLLFNLYIFYGVNRDIEYIILEDDFSFFSIEFICVLVVLIGVALPNFISGIKQQDNLAYSSIGFSGATFCSLGFSGLYYPLDQSSKVYLFFPFLHYAYEFVFFGLALFFAIALVFRKSKTNHKLHICAIVIGFLLAVALRPKLVLEIVGHIKNRFS